MKKILIDKNVNLYTVVIPCDEGWYTPEQINAPGETLKEVVTSILSGEHEDVQRVLCIWGPNAGTDMTSAVRDVCLETYFQKHFVRFDPNYTEDHAPPFVKCHDKYEEYIKENLREI